MEVRKGYKQTEVGVIPEDWEVKLLPDVCRFRAGKAHEQYISNVGQFVCVNAKFISTNGKVRKYSTENFCKAKQDDIILVMSDLPNGKTLAKTYLVDQDNLYAVNQSVCVLTPYRDHPKYLFYILNRNPYFLKFDDGINQTHLLKPVFQKCLLPLPSVRAEQEAIAEALSDADVFIEAVEQLLTKKRQVKQGAMSELLTGKRRLPNIKQTKLVQTDLGNFPSDWELTPLGAIVDPSRSIRYGIVQPGKYDHQGRFMIRGQDYSKGWADPSEVFRVSDVVEARYKNARVKTGDLIMTIVGSCGIVETIPEWLNGANLTQTTVRIAILPSKANSQFCKYMLQTEVGTLQVNNFMKGAVQPGLNCADVEKFFIPLPADTTEQIAIAEILSDMDAEISALEEKLVKARQVKAGMMSELLTGKIRLV